jgi:hypothetical protein
LITLLNHHRGERTNSNDLLGRNRNLEELHHAVEMTFTLMRVMVRLRSWNQELSYSFLKHLLGEAPQIVQPQVAA